MTDKFIAKCRECGVAYGWDHVAFHTLGCPLISVSGVRLADCDWPKYTTHVLHPGGEAIELQVALANDAAERLKALVTASPAGPFTVTGKEVLMNGAHYADATDDAAASRIADACNAHHAVRQWVTSSTDFPPPPADPA